MTWLKNKWLLLYCIIITAVAVYLFVLIRSGTSDSGIKSQLQELKAELKPIRETTDSLLKLVEIPLPEEKTDSLLEVSIKLNNKTLNELRKQNNDRIDTLSRSELVRIFAEFE